MWLFKHKEGLSHILFKLWRQKQAGNRLGADNNLILSSNESNHIIRL